jgi:hypothetical protein
VSASGLAVRGSAYAADRDFKEGLVRAVARPGAAAGRNSIPDYACRRSLRAVVDAGSIPAASIIRMLLWCQVGSISRRYMRLEMWRFSARIASRWVLPCRVFRSR